MVWIPLLAILAGTNYYVDPANIFHFFVNDIAEALVAGNDVAIYTPNNDERGLKVALIQSMPQHVECLTLGSSLTMGIRAEDAGTDSYYNLSASNFNYNDFMASFALLEKYGIEYDRVILCFDTSFFEEQNSLGMLNEQMMPYAHYMNDTIEGEDVTMPDVDPLGVDSSRFEQLLSVTYFQASADFIMSSGSFIMPQQRWYIVDGENEERGHYLSDGSWVYSRAYLENDPQFVIHDASIYGTQYVFARDRHISPYHQEHFRMLIEYLLARGVQVDLYLSPLSPALWDNIQSEADRYFILDEMEQYQREMAEVYGLRVIGTYNPYVVGLTNEDYMDCRHLRHESMAELFDFTY